MQISLKVQVVLLLFFSTLSFSQSNTKNFIDQPYIEVTGTAETEIIPNEIFLKIILNENDSRGKQPIEKQENLMLATLKSLEIDITKNLTVLDFNGRYRRKFFGDSEVAKIKHYQLIVDSGKLMDEVYDALDQCDISNISITKTSHTELEKFRKATKLKALKTAKEKATNYADVIGQTIGKALFIQEIGKDIIKHGYANSVNTNYVTAESNYQVKREIENLNLKPIILKESVMTKFILN